MAPLSMLLTITTNEIGFISVNIPAMASNLQRFCLDRDVGKILIKYILMARRRSVFFPRVLWRTRRVTFPPQMLSFNKVVHGGCKSLSSNSQMGSWQRLNPMFPFDLTWVWLWSSTLRSWISRLWFHCSKRRKGHFSDFGFGDIVVKSSLLQSAWVLTMWFQQRL